MEHGGARADACNVGVRDGKGAVQPEKIELASRWALPGVDESSFLRGPNQWGHRRNYGHAAGRHDEIGRGREPAAERIWKGEEAMLVTWLSSRVTWASEE
jgi:hypothetical protein